MRIEAPNVTELQRLMKLRNMQWVWSNFTPSELASKDTGRIIIQTDSLDRLQKLRERMNRPLSINSGYRTPEENARKSNTGLTGPHTTGYARDIKCLDGAMRGQLVKYAIELGYTGIGIANTFVHLDDVPPNTPHIPRFAGYPVIWLY